MDDLDIVFNKVTVDKILPLSKELSARFPHEVNGRKDTVNAVFSSSFPIIKKSRQSFIFLLKVHKLGSLSINEIKIFQNLHPSESSLSNIPMALITRRRKI